MTARGRRYNAWTGKNESDESTDLAQSLLHSDDAQLAPTSTKLAKFPRERFKQFCSKLKIITKDKGLTLLDPWFSQLYVIEQIANGVDEGISEFVVLKSRQMGLTTILLALDLFWMLEHDGLCAAFIIHEDRAMARMRMVIKSYLDSLPAAYKKTPKPENRTMLVLGKSIMMYLTAGTKERSSGGMGRSGAVNFCHFSEEAFYGSPDDLKQFSSAMSSRYPHRLYIHESTANGFNQFYELCNIAQTEPSVRFIFVPWHFNDAYRIERNDPNFEFYMPGGDASPLSSFERRKILEAKKKYGVDIDREQLAWYRWQLAVKKSGDQNMMDQEHPWVPDDAFIASGSRYFSNAALTSAMRRVRDIPFQPIKYQLGDSWQDLDVEPANARTCDLRVWEAPVDHGKYVIACDPAFGSSELADRTVISVWRCFADKISQVAEFASNQIATYACAWVLAHLAGYYKDCLVILEITGPGLDVHNELKRLKTTTMSFGANKEESSVLEKMRSFIYKRGDSVTGQSGHSWHPKMSFDLKWQIFSRFKSEFETHNCIVNSGPLLNEMRTVLIKDGSIDHSPHTNDDRAVAAAYAVYAWNRDLRFQLVAEGRTFERERLPPETPKAPVELAVMRYLKAMRIDMNDGKRP